MSTAREIAGRFQAASASIPAASAAAVRDAAITVQAAVAAASGAHASSPLTRTRVTMITSPTVGALVRMTSKKAHLLDHDTKAHDIVNGAATGRRTQAAALATPYGPKASVHSPGTHGQFMWERGVAAAIPAVAAIFDARVGTAIAKAFGE
jgi:hypothetical protein